MEDEPLMIVIVCFLMLALGAVIGAGGRQDLCRKEAIAAKVGQYTINPNTGERKFEYISPK